MTGQASVHRSQPQTSPPSRICSCSQRVSSPFFWVSSERHRSRVKRPCASAPWRGKNILLRNLHILSGETKDVVS